MNRNEENNQRDLISQMRGNATSYWSVFAPTELTSFGLLG